MKPPSANPSSRHERDVHADFLRARHRHRRDRRLDAARHHDGAIIELRGRDNDACRAGRRKWDANSIRSIGLGIRDADRSSGGRIVRTRAGCGPCLDADRRRGTGHASYDGDARRHTVAYGRCTACSREDQWDETNPGTPDLHITLLSTGYPTPCLTLSHQPPMVDSPFGLEPPLESHCHAYRSLRDTRRHGDECAERSTATSRRAVSASPGRPRGEHRASGHGAHAGRR